MSGEEEYLHVDQVISESGSYRTGICKSSETIVVGFRSNAPDDIGFRSSYLTDHPHHHHCCSHGDTQIQELLDSVSEFSHSGRQSPFHHGEPYPVPISFGHTDEHPHPIPHPPSDGYGGDAGKVMPPQGPAGSGDPYGGAGGSAGAQGPAAKPTTPERPEFGPDGVRILYYSGS
ncbi:unnamed protein product [Anisakis simplex]|uniref:Bravo_FIGEY domain-containing protein n=1 Tax=Anisakis simplex TaxID=6269 RepID=A0A0M3K9K5_ANISI|nr:unnamed protein product [Anisakis simplex]